MNKQIVTEIIIAVEIIVGAFVFIPKNSSGPIIDSNIVNNQINNTTTISNSTTTNAVIVSENVITENGVQIINLQAKGGYSPQRTVARAGVPTVLRFSTNGTFDCSLSVRISSINYSKVLPQTGSTDVDLGVQKVGLFRGSCGMGMYPFEVDFQ
jgi:hypothetical protein